MRWKDYRLLTPEQKEEWQFRFKDNEFKISYADYWLFTLASTMMLFAAYLYDAQGHHAQAIEYASLASKTIVVFAYIFILAIAFNLFVFMFRGIQEILWHRKIREARRNGRLSDR